MPPRKKYPPIVQNKFPLSKDGMVSYFLETAKKNFSIPNWNPKVRALATETWENPEKNADRLLPIGTRPLSRAWSRRR